MRSSPALAGNTVYFGADDGHLYAVNAENGAKLWDVVLGDTITSSPVVVGSTLYIGSTDGKLYAIK